MPQKSLSVEVLGHDYPLRIDEADEAFTRRVAAYVDERMRDARTNVTGVSDLTHAVLGALAITEELFLIRDELARARDGKGGDFDAVADDLADRLDAVLGT